MGKRKAGNTAISLSVYPAFFLSVKMYRREGVKMDIPLKIHTFGSTSF